MNWIVFVIGVMLVIASFGLQERLARRAEADIDARGGPGRLYYWTVFLMPLAGLFAWWLARVRLHGSTS